MGSDVWVEGVSTGLDGKAEKDTGQGWERKSRVTTLGPVVLVH